MWHLKYFNSHKKIMKITKKKKKKNMSHITVSIKDGNKFEFLNGNRFFSQIELS